MTLTLELPPDLEKTLADEARRNGKTLEQFLQDDLRTHYLPSESASAYTLPDDVNGKEATP